MLYFTRLDRKPSVGVHQTQFYCQNPRLELDVRTRLVGVSAVAAMQRPPCAEEHCCRRSFQAHTNSRAATQDRNRDLQVGALRAEFQPSDSWYPCVRENVARFVLFFVFCFVLFLKWLDTNLSGLFTDCTTEECKLTSLSAVLGDRLPETSQCKTLGESVCKESAPAGHVTRDATEMLASPSLLKTLVAVPSLWLFSCK